jgi:phage shock protein PspC (stress-responsive transcriptional regulator)
MTPEPPSSGSPPPPLRRAGYPDDAVFGGVASEIAYRLDTDPLWVRLAFVGLAVFGGLGVVLYAGLWLVLRGLRRGPMTFVGVCGYAVLFLGTLLILGGGATHTLDSRWVVVLVLAGIAVALWQPRQARALPPVGEAERTGAAGAAWPPPEPGADPNTSPPAPPAARRPAPRPPRPQSTLGYYALGLALLVAAGGAVVDELNGGRLHPEQWLGAAAAVCGLAIVLSSFLGRAMWLVVPALLFAGSGFVAGHAARVGVSTLEMGSRNYVVSPNWYFVGDEDLLAGSIRLDVEGAADQAIAIDFRVAMGLVEVYADDDVSVEVRTRVHSGDVVVDGVDQRGADRWRTYRLGPESAEPDVSVTAEVSLGAVRLHSSLDYFARVLPVEPVEPIEPRVPIEPLMPPGVDVERSMVDLGEGFRMTPDGTVLFPSFSGIAGWLTPDGLVGGDLAFETSELGVTTVYLDTGNALVLPSHMIVTPSGAVIDVPAARAALGSEQGEADEPAVGSVPTNDDEPTIATEPRVSAP